jgi:alpha-glucosidase
MSIPPDAVRDPFERNVPGRGFGCDPERTPMQWDAGPHALAETPWLPIADATGRSTSRPHADARSMLSLHRALIERRATPALAVGSYRSIYTDDDLPVYERETGAYGRRRWRNYRAAARVSTVRRAGADSDLDASRQAR